MGQERLGPSYFFISLVLQPLMVRTFLKVYMELGSYFLFLQEQIKDIIIFEGPHHLQGFTLPYSEVYIISMASPHILWPTISSSG